MDHELLLARMASFDLSKPFANGPDRGDLRVRTSIDAALHPAQTIWSHVLDAEPLALCSTDEQFVFILWKKGIYAMGKGTGEDWRKPEPSWPELEKLPHADAVVSASIQGIGIRNYNNTNCNRVLGYMSRPPAFWDPPTMIIIMMIIPCGVWEPPWGGGDEGCRAVARRTYVIIY